MPVQCLRQSANKGACSDSPINWKPKSSITGSIQSADTWTQDVPEHEDKHEDHKNQEAYKKEAGSPCYSSCSDYDYYSDDHDYDDGYDDDSGGSKEDDNSRTLHLVIRDRRALGPPPGFEEIYRKVPLLNPLLKLEPIDHEVELTEKENQGLGRCVDVRPRLIKGSPAVCKF